ncbi:uncharacterized protein LOC105438815 [Strongylocentrotus purpuratus]|uniref:Uncharacterized protein n=1 Tax=Strongylocentrotus purpuratus TaxID=7668 RepID=A0A7M7NAK8_STRPU|nr:uncharacterized protein LOC105438815 [Strongylocentrotus purpuratus]
MDGFCLLYLLLILLMRSGDIETNPGPNPAVSTVSEMEFLKLAQDIAPSYYEAVGISLGIPRAQLQAILSEQLKNYASAFMDVFMKWNVMQQPPHSNKRQLLADKLRKIDLGGLSDRLLNEPLIPNSQGQVRTSHGKMRSTLKFAEDHQDCLNHRPNLLQLDLRPNHFLLNWLSGVQMISSSSTGQLSVRSELILSILLPLCS